MEKKHDWRKILLMVLSYVLVAVVACASTVYFMLIPPANRLQYMQMLAQQMDLQKPGEKLGYLYQLIDSCYVEEPDWKKLDDGAANGLVEALPDRWSYYIPASQRQTTQESMDNAYVGVGIVISSMQDGVGYHIDRVEPGGGAKEAGILPGDILVAVEGVWASESGSQDIRDLVRGEEGTQVLLTVLRDGQELEFRVTRKKILAQVAMGTMLPDQVGYITIKNFNSRCAEETIAQIEALLQQGATSLIFDVRFNSGGYQAELVKLLDYLLPEGELFRSVYYTGEETVDRSDAKCVDLPMAVLMNGSSYSAAEFFAAALDEYDRAILVGEATVGKGYFQSTFDLPDGSAVALSIGKYYTPKGRCLEDVGGLTPEVPVEVDTETAMKIYSELLDPMEDPQVLAALEALKK